TVDDAGSAKGELSSCHQTVTPTTQPCGELSTCKGRPPNFVRSSDDELVDTGDG
ncbi:3038_t:CDS:2, partial [Gigaspora rosea]